MDTRRLLGQAFIWEGRRKVSYVVMLTKQTLHHVKQVQETQKKR